MTGPRVIARTAVAVCGPRGRVPARSGETAYPAIGVESGVTFWYVDVVGEHPDVGTSIRACVGATCQRLVIDQGDIPMVHVSVDGWDESPRTVALTVVDRSATGSSGATPPSTRRRPDPTDRSVRPPRGCPG